MCGLPRSLCLHEGCFALGFDKHQDMVTITTVDQDGTETAHRCRRCNANFGTMYVPHRRRMTAAPIGPEPRTDAAVGR